MFASFRISRLGAAPSPPPLTGGLPQCWPLPLSRPRLGRGTSEVSHIAGSTYGWGSLAARHEDMRHQSNHVQSQTSRLPYSDAFARESVKDVVNSYIEHRRESWTSVDVGQAVGAPLRHVSSSPSPSSAASRSLDPIVGGSQMEFLLCPGPKRSYAQRDGRGIRPDVSRGRGRYSAGESQAERRGALPEPCT